MYLPHHSYRKAPTTVYPYSPDNTEYNCVVKCIRIITLRADFQCEDVLSDLLTSEVWTHAVVIALHQIVQDFGYVPVVV